MWLYHKQHDYVWIKCRTTGRKLLRISNFICIAIVSWGNIQVSTLKVFNCLSSTPWMLQIFIYLGRCLTKHVKFLQLWKCLSVYALSNECSRPSCTKGKACSSTLKAKIYFLSPGPAKTFILKLLKFFENIYFNVFYWWGHVTWRHNDIQKNFQNVVGMFCK